MTTALMAAACTACPKHAIAAVAGAFIIGVLVGRFTKKGPCAATCGQKKPQNGATKARKAQMQAEPREVTRAPVPAGSVEIYVGNLSYELGEEDLRKMFVEFGTVDSARIVLNRFNNKSKGFGFVVMPNRAEAEKAIAALSEKEYMGRKMRVNEAKNTLKEDREDKDA